MNALNIIERVGVLVDIGTLRDYLEIKLPAKTALEMKRSVEFLDRGSNPAKVIAG